VGDRLAARCRQGRPGVIREDRHDADADDVLADQVRRYGSVAADRHGQASGTRLEPTGFSELRGIEGLSLSD